MDEPQRHHAKWNKSQKDKHCDLHELSKAMKFVEEIQIQTKFIEIVSMEI